MERRIMGRVKRLRKIKRANKRGKSVCRAMRELGQACEKLTADMTKQFPRLMAMCKRVADEIIEKQKKRGL